MQLRMMRLGQAALVLAALWSGCAPGGARAAGTPAVRLAYQDRVGSVIPLVAVRQGFFKEAGVDVAARQFNNGPACAEALYSGAVDVAAMGDKIGRAHV
jgi:sulfonate transport system substrate-binding protein